MTQALTVTHETGAITMTCISADRAGRSRSLPSRSSCARRGVANVAGLLGLDAEVDGVRDGLVRPARLMLVDHGYAEPRHGTRSQGSGAYQEEGQVWKPPQEVGKLWALVVRRGPLDR